MKTFYENAFDSLNRRASRFLREAEGSDDGKEQLFELLAEYGIDSSLKLSEIIIGYLQTYYGDRDEDPIIAKEYDQLRQAFKENKIGKGHTDPNWLEHDYLKRYYPNLTALLSGNYDEEDESAAEYLRHVVNGALKTYVYNEEHKMPGRKRDSFRRYDKRLHEGYDFLDLFEIL